MAALGAAAVFAATYAFDRHVAASLDGGLADALRIGGTAAPCLGTGALAR